MSLKSQIRKIKKIVGNNQIEKALLEMEQFEEEELENIIILHKRNIEENKKQFNLGLKNVEDFNVTKTRISLAILESLDALANMKDVDISQQFLQFGKLRLTENDFLSAKLYLDKAIIENSSLIEAYLERGATKLALEEYKEALQDLSIVLKKEPNNSIALYNMGIALFQLGELDEACKLWKKVKTLGFDLADKAINLCY